MRGKKTEIDIVSLVKALWKYTGLNQAQITAVLGIPNQGRTCEYLNWPEYAEVPPAEHGDWVHDKVRLAVALFGKIGPRR